MRLRLLVGRMLGAVGLRRVVRRIEGALRPERFAAADSATPGAVERALMEARAAGLTRNGDYYEFGLYRGYTFWAAQDFMTKAGEISMRFVGFDSFEGLPEPEGVDRYQGDYVKGQYRVSLDSVRSALNEHGVDWNRTLLVPGFFERTLTPSTVKEHGLRAAAVVLIDCDLYSSAVVVLNFLSDLLIDGSYVLFDDWNDFDADDERGERRAFREFLHSHPQWSAKSVFDYGVYGTAFRLSNPARPPIGAGTSAGPRAAS
jgi:O-methyltransferase